MAAPKENRFYLSRLRDGPKPKHSAQSLLTAFSDFAVWVNNHPIKCPEKVLVGAKLKTIPHVKPRMATLCGFRAFINISKSTWSEWRKREDLSNPVSVIEDFIENDQVTLAAVGAVKDNIVIRLQGYVDNRKHEIGVGLHEDFLKNLEPYKPPDEHET